MFSRDGYAIPRRQICIERPIDMTSEMTISFPGNLKVDAGMGNRVIRTDQSELSGGDGSAPEPFSLFLASIGTCAGIYVLRFCQVRNIPTDDIRLVQRVISREGGGIDKVEIDIEVPPDFPSKYHKSLVRAANQCAVKKVIENPPEFETRTVQRTIIG